MSDARDRKHAGRKQRVQEIEQGALRLARRTQDAELRAAFLLIAGLAKDIRVKRRRGVKETEP